MHIIRLRKLRMTSSNRTLRFAVCWEMARFISFRISSQRSEQLGSPTSIVNSVFGPSSPVASPQQSQLQSPIDVFYQQQHQQPQHLTPAKLRLKSASSQLSPREQPFNRRHHHDYSNFWKFKFTKRTLRGPKKSTRWQHAERNPASWSHDAATGCGHSYYSWMISKKKSNKPKNSLFSSSKYAQIL